MTADRDRTDQTKFRDIVEDDWYRAGGGFRWCWPKFDLLHAADRVTTVGFNRYPHNIIGWAAYFRGRGFGVRWKRS